MITMTKMLTRIMMIMLIRMTMMLTRMMMMSAVPSATARVAGGVAVVGSGGQLRSQRRQRGVVAGWVKMMMMVMAMIIMMTMMDIMMTMIMHHLVVLWGR